MSAISDKPWGSFSQSDYHDAGAYCDASLVNTNTGPRSSWAKSACHLPVSEPDGALNRNGVHAAAARLAGAGGGTSLSPDERRAAARKLVGFYHDLEEDPPESIRRLAGL